MQSSSACNSPRARPCRRPRCSSAGPASAACPAARRRPSTTPSSRRSASTGPGSSRPQGCRSNRPDRSDRSDRPACLRPISRMPCQKIPRPCCPGPALRRPAAPASGAGQAAPGLRPLRPALRLALRMTIERVALRRQRHGLRPGGMAAPCAGAPVGDLPAFPGALRAGVVVAPLAPSVGHLRALPDDPGARPVLRARNSLLHDEKPAMSPRRLRPRRALLVCRPRAGGPLPASPAPAADAGPAKPIQLVIPYPPGGSADLLGRPLAAQRQQQLGQPVVLEYKPGAGGTLASHYVARAKPDGYTLLMVLAAHAINDSLYPKLPYDTRKDFVPVSLLANLPMVVAASSKLRARNI